MEDVVSKPKYPWLHKMTAKQRSDMLDADFESQRTQAIHEAAGQLRERGMTQAEAYEMATEIVDNEKA
jgi:hypothetical protein